MPSYPAWRKALECDRDRTTSLILAPRRSPLPSPLPWQNNNNTHTQKFFGFCICVFWKYLCLVGANVQREPWKRRPSPELTEMRGDVCICFSLSQGPEAECCCKWVEDSRWTWRGEEGQEPPGSVDVLFWVTFLTFKDSINAMYSKTAIDFSF